jgi:DNA-binding transcriptional LysR family regulator
VELDWLETFLAVVDRGGFTAASAQVHRSQSRVSAHIAALERELGVQLIDRARRPATLTPAGQIFATHAREILADVGSARSAIGILRALDEESVAVLTTPCIGAALFPKVVGDLLAGHPNARVALSEHGWQEGERRHPAEGFVLAVLPSLPRPHPPGLQERVLWREPIQAVVPADHELAQARSGAGPIEPARLATQHLVISGMTMSTVPQILLTLGARGLETVPRTTVDTPQTLVTMVRAGVGIGVANAVGLENTDTTGLVIMDIDDPEMFRVVAVYWYDELLSSDVGQSLLRGVIQAQPPPGGSRIGQDGEVLLTGPGISQSNDGNFSAAQRLSQR